MTRLVCALGPSHGARTLIRPVRAATAEARRRQVGGLPLTWPTEQRAAQHGLSFCPRSCRQLTTIFTAHTCMQGKMMTERKESFNTRARSRHLVVPDETPASDAAKREVLWDGKMFHIVPKGKQLQAQAYTYCTGENMVGQVETASTATTRLIGGKYRSVNRESNVKECCAWKPGNRFTHRVRPCPEGVAGKPAYPL